MERKTLGIDRPKETGRNYAQTINEDHVQVSLIKRDDRTFRVEAWGKTFDGFEPRAGEFVIGYRGGQIKVGSEVVPWMVRGSDYVFLRNRWHKATLARYPYWVHDMVMQSVDVMFPRIFGVLAGYSKGEPIFRQPMEIGPSLKICKKSGVITSASLWYNGTNVRGKLKKRKAHSIPLNWITSEGRWSDPQYEYLAREELIRAKERFDT